MSRAFVTGGSGFIGRHLVQRLVDDGHAVSGLARSRES
jgi:nucleoside-diphosphate-sugar epimerase